MEVQILIVDDDPAIRNVIIRFLSRKGLIADVAESGKEALVKLEANNYRILVTDLHLPDTTEKEKAFQARAFHPEIINILVSGSGVTHVKNPTVFNSIIEKGGSLTALVDHVMKFIRRET